ncbi:MAG: low molecular weight phosphotyrosine protein phosphatase [Bacteroidia bacterium]|nr:low molecular weight phosphotyrosine protein phosphatase [Bacteroidia bacterium]
MQKVLFVCLGNICRSPLAEGIMLHLKEKHDLKMEIDSAGTAAYHIGEAPDRRTILNAKKNGVDLSALRARQFSASDFDKFDRIYVMDQSNLNNVLRLAKTKAHEEKTKLLLDLVEPGQQMEVPDPYYGGEEGFERVFQLVLSACERLKEELKK